MTLKHMAMNDFENARTNTAVKLDERMLHELELQAFEKGIEAGHAGSIMCAYSRISQSDTGFDTYSCGNNLLLNTIARDEFGFTGWVLTDFGAVHRLSDLLGGVDSAMPNGNVAGIGTSRTLATSPTRRSTTTCSPTARLPGRRPGSGKTLTQAVLNGTNAIPVNGNYPPIPAVTGAQWPAALDNAVFHILTSMNRAGLLEGTPYGSQAAAAPPPRRTARPFVPPRPDLQALMAPDFEIAKNVAEESATLLKNTDGALPLRRTDFAGNGVLVMGPTATATYVGGGGSAHVTPFEPITNSLTALRRPPARARSTTSRATTSTASSCPRRRRRPTGAERLAAPADLDDGPAPPVPSPPLRRHLRAPTGSTRLSTTRATRARSRRDGVALDDALHRPAARPARTPGS